MNTQRHVGRYRFGRAVQLFVIVFLILFQTFSPLTPIPRVYAATFEVNSTANDFDASTTDPRCLTNNNECTLLAAIQQANATAGEDRITFNIPGTGPHIIAPTASTELPVIFDPLIIDGYTQPGASANTLAVGNDAKIQIELNGDACSGCSGLVLIADGNTVQGLVITGAFNDGIQIFSNNNVVAGNFIGIGADGRQAGITNAGMLIFGGEDNIIGGTAPADRNVIANNLDGILLSCGNECFMSGNVVQGNYIGTDPTGSAPQGNTRYGVFLEGRELGPPGTVNANTIGGLSAAERNVISGNNVAGVALAHVDGGDVSGNFIQGNYIGIDATGTADLGNSRYGVFITGGASDNTIGGLDVRAGNTIAFNNDAGIYLDGGSGNALLSNAIFGNPSPIALVNNANNNPITPTLTSAIPAANTTNVQGWMFGVPETTYQMQFFRGNSCGEGGVAEARSTLVNVSDNSTSISVTTDISGTAAFSTTVIGALSLGEFVTGTAGVGNNTSALATCVPAGPDNDTWYTAMPLTTAPTATVQQYLALPEQVRWYRVGVQPGSRIEVNLSNLPGVYDLALFDDIGAAAQALAASDSVEESLLVQQAQIDYDALEASNFVTNTLAPEVISPEAYTSEALSQGNFSPSVLAPIAVSPFKTSPFKTSPFKTSPFKTSPFKTSPFKTSPFKTSPFKTSEIESEIAVESSLLSYSALEGTQPRSLVLNTWDRDGEIYIAVFGRNGIYVPNQPFTLQVTQQTSVCSNVTQPDPIGPLLAGQAGNYRTIILTYPSRIVGTEAEKAALDARLTEFAARDEVRGAIVNVGNDGLVAATSPLADTRAECPTAQNYFAAAVKDIVDRYRELNPELAYVVIVGGDSTIPFFRYPDQALLGNESEFVPPVLDTTPAQASLRLGYVLGQDEYGASVSIPFKSTILSVPDLAVGRLVETAAEAKAMLDVYINLNGVITPASTLVSGYDFHLDSSLVISRELALGTGQPVDGLLSPSTDSYQAPGTWTADDLRAQIYGNRYDLLYLAGHFSDGALLAADYTTTLQAEELLVPQVNLTGSLVVSPGCHSGYSTIDSYAINGYTQQPDWAQAFARKGATLIAGTGYQYGDTEFIQFAEALYVKFSEQLRIGTGPVPIGRALVLAKQRYLINSAVIRGLDLKSLTIGTLYGLPMMQINMTGQRLIAPSSPPIIAGTTPLVGPGAAFNLHFAEAVIAPTLTTQTLDLKSLEDGSTQTATYLTGADGVVAPPTELVLPFEQRNVSVAGRMLRGVGFWSGSYTDLPNILPLTGAPATELRGVHVTFPAETFYPERIWGTNYFGAITQGSSGETRLNLTPAQFIASAPGSATGTLRRYDSMQFRFYYSDDTTKLPSEVIPALSGPPAIMRVTSAANGSDVTFQVIVNGSENVAVQEVWITYTGLSAPLYGQWQSLSLTQSASDTSLWEGTLTGVANPDDLRFMVQAVSAVGYHTLNTNQGRYYQVGIDPGEGGESSVGTPTTLSILTAPDSATYATEATFTARLQQTSDSVPLANQRLALSVGTLTVRETTDASGVATFTLPLRITPGGRPVTVTFAGTGDYQPARDERQITILKVDTTLTLIPGAARLRAAAPAALLTAVLRDGVGNPLAGEQIVFILRSGNRTYTNSERTDINGMATLEPQSLPAGRYTIQAYFIGTIPLSGTTVTVSSTRYNPTNTTSELVVTGELFLPIIRR